MKNKKPNAEHIWKQFEDLLVPRLRLCVKERAMYSHLLRHSHLEGRRRLRFSISWLARGVRLTDGPVRDSPRRLFTRGVLRLVQRSRAGHLIEVRLPEEIRGARESAPPLRTTRNDAADFLESRSLRQAIHARERGRCFYCLGRTTRLVRCLDHVVPLARRGDTCYRNLVSSCMECNSQKGEEAAEDFLRGLYRERRLTAAELAARLRALDALASGKLPPVLPWRARL
jgi:5-methylcytosine-specific restriction endonuclease McrA